MYTGQTIISHDSFDDAVATLPVLHHVPLTRNLATKQHQVESMVDYVFETTRLNFDYSVVLIMFIGGNIAR